MTSIHAKLIQSVDAGDEAAVEQWLTRNGDRPLPDAEAIIQAAYRGHEAIVRLLLPVSDPKAKNSWALACAAWKGHEASVCLLLPVSDPKGHDSLALACAAEHGHEAIVQLLLPVSDPKANASWALKKAALNGHEAIVAILVEASDAVEAWRTLMIDEAWEGLDHLARYMPKDTVEAVLKQAPPDAMPRSRAHQSRQSLAKTLTGAVDRSLKNRL